MTKKGKRKIPISIPFFNAKLPERKYWEEISPTEKYYRWQNVKTPDLRILSETPAIWTGEPYLILPRVSHNSPNDVNWYPRFLNLVIQPYNEEAQDADMVVEFGKFYFLHTSRPCLFFAGFPLDEIGNWWLTVSFYQKQES